MPDLTTAQRLAAYREELREAGFNDTEVNRFVATAAPSLVEDLQVQADLDNGDLSVGEVRVRLTAQWDEDDLQRVVEHVQATVSQAADQ